MLTDKEIINYAKNIVISNLHQYTEGNIECLNEIISLSYDDINNQILLGHLKGLNNLINKAIDIIEGENNNDK